jgi:hypothetical protein
MLHVVRDMASERKLRLFGAACCRRVWHFLPPGPEEFERLPAPDRDRFSHDVDSDGVFYDEDRRLCRVDSDGDFFDDANRRGYVGFNRFAVNQVERFADGTCDRRSLDELVPLFAYYDKRNDPLFGDHAFQTWLVIEPDAFHAACAAAWAAAQAVEDAEIAKGLAAGPLEPRPPDDADSLRVLLPDAWSVAGRAHLASSDTLSAAAELKALERKAQADLLRDIMPDPSRPVNFEESWIIPEALALARTLYVERELPSGNLDKHRLNELAGALENAGCTSGDILQHCRSPGPHVRGCWAVDLVLGNK